MTNVLKPYTSYSHKSRPPFVPLFTVTKLATLGILYTLESKCWS